MYDVYVSKTCCKPFDEEVFEAVKRGIDKLGGVKSFAKPGDNVLVKPNICSNDLHRTTDRRIYYYLAILFRDYGCNVTIGENPVIDTPSKKVFMRNEIKRIAEKSGVRVVNFRFDEYRVVKVPNPKLFTKLEVTKYALEADLIVNVPIMRKHGLSGLTLGIKNLFGLVSLNQRHIIHSRNLYWGLVEIYRLFKDKLRLTVMDGINAALNGTLYPLGLIVFGKNILAVDIVTSYLLGWDPFELETNRYASQMNLGPKGLSEIKIDGISMNEIDKIREITKQYFNPELERLEDVADRLGIKLVLGDICPTCRRNITKILREFRKEDFKNKNIAIIAGPGAIPLKDRVNIIIGECLKKYAGEGIFVNYCPTYLSDIKSAIEYAIGRRKERKYLWEGLIQLISNPI